MIRRARETQTQVPEVPEAGSLAPMPPRSIEENEREMGDDWATTSDASDVLRSARERFRAPTASSASRRSSKSRDGEPSPRQRPRKLPSPVHMDPWEDEKGEKEEDEKVPLPNLNPTHPSNGAGFQATDVNWFWLSQTDIIPGFWATPWREFQQLSSSVCVGAVATFIEALGISFGNAEGVRYRSYGPGCSDTVEAMLQGKRTYPAYAHGADGGVVCGGVYSTVSHRAFAQPIPTIDLIGSYEDHINQAQSSSQESCERRLVELMRLDAWLSLVGRTPEISEGPSRLLEQTPALVQSLMSEYHERFYDLTMESAAAGEYGKLGGVAIIWLEFNRLTAAERIYVLVAGLRTAKVGQAVLAGSDTRLLKTIFEKDTQVYLV
ncbi:hypothetical protein B0I35DRAFT_119475 [Stachybotrys elegans]|uniref:Uncharacterized protein n=1 Tax=Stachybotrys elegans TaxID=80388 RepID=A0A8K0SY08_9HYPO|nr:hypothetical protein B0I35DRAFT_119475 [Stachybotrys elegans]